MINKIRRELQRETAHWVREASLWKSEYLRGIIRGIKIARFIVDKIYNEEKAARS